MKGSHHGIVAAIGIITSTTDEGQALADVTGGGANTEKKN